MADCQFLGGCIFFNDKMVHMPKTAEMIKKKFCLGDHSKCARYMVVMSLGKESVPPNLFPGESDVAQIIISSAKKGSFSEKDNK